MSGLNHFMKMGDMVEYAKSKGVDPAKPCVVVSGLFMLIGGTEILLGIYIELAVLWIVLALLGITFRMHQFWKEEDSQSRMVEMSNFMKNMALMGASLAYLMIPMPWMYSLVM